VERQRARAEGRAWVSVWTAMVCSFRGITAGLRRPRCCAATTTTRQCCHRRGTVVNTPMRAGSHAGPLARRVPCSGRQSSRAGRQSSRAGRQAPLPARGGHSSPPDCGPRGLRGSHSGCRPAPRGSWRGPARVRRGSGATGRASGDCAFRRAQVQEARLAREQVGAGVGRRVQGGSHGAADRQCASRSRPCQVSRLCSCRWERCLMTPLIGRCEHCLSFRPHEGVVSAMEGR